MLINLRNALMAGKRLPYDAEVEYLESTGTQYINTGIMGASEWHITAQGAATPTTSNCVIATTSSGGSFFGNYGAIDYWAVGNGASWRCSLPYTSIGSFIVTFSASSVQFMVNGETVTRLSAPNFSKAFYLYSTNGEGYGAKVRVYGCKVYQNGILVRDFIPVRKGTVGYLYDRVSGKLFGNEGSGDFVLGQDVVPMTWQDGLQYNNVGTPVESATSSIGLDYIPITAGHSFTWRLGYGSSASADLIIYNANKERIDYWVARDRTVTISGAAAYMRISALTSYKEQATVYDETAQKYVFANGRIPAE